MLLSVMLQAAGGSNPLIQLIPFVLIFVVLYFFMIRPQQKRQKELKKYRDALQKGDKVITTGGLYGIVAEVKDNVVMVEIADNVKIKVDKAAIIMDMTDASAK